MPDQLAIDRTWPWAAKWLRHYTEQGYTSEEAVDAVVVQSTHPVNLHDRRLLEAAARELAAGSRQEVRANLVTLYRRAQRGAGLAGVNRSDLAEADDCSVATIGRRLKAADWHMTDLRAAVASESAHRTK